jgi:outer membrane protein TolC
MTQVARGVTAEIQARVFGMNSRSPYRTRWRLLRLAPGRLSSAGAVFVFVLLCVAAVMGWPASAAAEGSRLTLADAVASALQRGSDAHIARLEADQAADGLGAERSSYLPHLAITSGAGYSNRQNDKLRAVNAQGREKVYQLQSLGAHEGWFNVELEQLLFDLGQWHRIEQQALMAEAARIAADERRDAVARDVLVAYVKVLRLEAQHALAVERGHQATWLDDQAGRLLRAGRILPSEHEQTAVLALEAGLDAESQAVELAEARSALRVAVGDPALDVSHLDPTSLPAAAFPASDLTSDQALAATPALRVLAVRKRAEERGLAAVRAARYPTVGMQAGYSNYGPYRHDNYNDDVSVNLAFRLPLFDGNRTTYEVANASKSVEIAATRYRMVLESKRVRMRALVERVGSTRARADLAERRAVLVRERVRLADLSLQGERGTVAEAMAARDAFARDAAAAVDARYDSVQTWADLLDESGQLAHVVLAEPVGAEPAPQ